MGSQELPQRPEKERVYSLFPAYISEQTRNALVALCQDYSENSEEQEDLAVQCVQYIHAFGRRFPQIAKALFHGEELGGTGKQKAMQQEAQQEYTGRDVRRGEIWNGAGEHCYAVAILAELLAQKMALSADAIERVTLAGGIHDWWKKHEVMHMWDAEDALAAEGVQISRETVESPQVISVIRTQFDAAKEEDRARLKTMGFSEEIIQLANANRLRDTQGPQTDEELILFFLDHVMSGVRPIPLMQRLQAAVTGNPSYLAYEASFKQQLGGRTSHQLLMEDGMAQQLQQRLAERIGYDGDPALFHQYLEKLFIEAVSVKAPL